jgi:hypothetical protein
MKVKNVKGTGDKDCSCGSWLNHWKRFSKKGASSICATACVDDATVGGHVQIESSTDKAIYIVPLCDRHNQQTESMEIDELKTPLVSANVSETCGRKSGNRAFYGES